MTEDETPKRSVATNGRWSMAAAVLAAVAASICCVGPLVLLALGVGGAWVSRVSALEPYRPALIGITLALLGFAFYRAHRTAATACGADGSCAAGSASRMTRALLWLVTPLVLALLVFPYVAAHVFARAAGGGSQSGRAEPANCCAIGASNALSAPATEPAGLTHNQRQQIDPARQIVFKVEQLGCPLVSGVGCGHLLAPTLARLNAIDDVSGSFANWTGDLIRISIDSNADRETVANRVEAALAQDQQKPKRVAGDELPMTLNKEEWRGVDRIAELTSYEFRAVARRRVGAFADAERLDQSTRQRLLALLDEVWERTAEGLGQPKPDAEAYAEYWHNRRDQFVTAYIERARNILSPGQVERLAKESTDRRK